MTLIIKYIVILYTSLVTLGGSIDPSFLSKFNTLRSSLPKSCKLVITSGFRSKEKNHKVGGAKNSFHLHGRAYDITSSCRELTIKKALFLGLSVIIYKKHLHLDNRTRQKCLIRNKSSFSPCKPRY